MAGTKSTRGFTLIEILVVIAIIGILAALLLPMLTGAKERALAADTSALIQSIKSACEQYQGQYGDYPPSHLLGYGIKTNRVNTGNEAMVACLATRNKGGPFMEFEDNELSNLDNDKAPKNLTNWYFGDLQLREVTDAWGNPLLYFHHRDYKSGSKYGTYMIDGKKVKIAPSKSTSQKNYPNIRSVMIWSVGPDQEDDAGGPDDLSNWK